MLYWAEGGKSTAGLDFVNSDPAMIRVFLNFLRCVCGVDESRLRVYLYCYADQDSKELIGFWSASTKIPEHQFTKPYVRSDFSESKKGKLRYGVVHIRYSDVRLLAVMKEWIAEYGLQFN
jgi:hypothetical protein